MKADVKSVLVCINLRFFFYINETLALNIMKPGTISDL